MFSKVKRKGSTLAVEVLSEKREDNIFVEKESLFFLIKLKPILISDKIKAISLVCMKLATHAQ